MKNIVAVLISLLSVSAFAETYYVNYSYMSKVVLIKSEKNTYNYLSETTDGKYNKISIRNNGTEISNKAVITAPLKLSINIGDETATIHDDNIPFSVTAPAKVIKKTFGGLVSVFPFYLQTNTNYFANLPSIINLAKEEVATTLGHENFTMTHLNEMGKGGACMADQAGKNTLVCTFMYNETYQVDVK